MNLSKHLTWDEFLTTSHADLRQAQLDWAKLPAIRVNAAEHAVDVWQPSRDLVGAIRVTSGIRCPELNKRVRGQPGSAHLEGRASDNQPLDMDILDAYERIRKSGIPFQKMIYEEGPGGAKWIHLQSHKLWTAAQKPERLTLMRLCDSNGIVSGFEKFNIRAARRISQ